METPPRNDDPPAQRLVRLAEALDALGLDGMVLPLADEHLGEAIPAGARRLEWLTGFSGSAGVAVLTKGRGILFVDGRYTLQAAGEVDLAAWEVRHLVEEGPVAWLSKNVAADSRIGFDPCLHSINGVLRLAKAGPVMVALEANPIDALWHERPAPPLAPLVAHPLDYAGRPAADKIAAIAALLAERKAGATVLNQPESVAWLLNVRGSDVPYTPMALCQAILFADGRVTLFIEPAKVDAAVRAHLGTAVDLQPPGAQDQALDALGRAKTAVSLDPDSANDGLRRRLEAAGASVLCHPDPCLEPRACKNAVEIDGMRAAHRRDGLAMIRFLAWLSCVPPGTLGEAEAAARLADFRAASPLYRGDSFAAISAAGPNAAIVHYRVSAGSDRRLEAGMLYLIDSGGQYLDGTTDVTRTIAIGRVDDATRRHVTLVLKGHIALTKVRFPEGVAGGRLDVLARQFLWQAGLDYDHGTGHGVGSYLSVHEGPQRISSTPGPALKPGMVLSIEPGCYRDGLWGIRIENLVLVRRGEAGFGGRAFLEFEPLTLVPIDRSLIEPAMMSAEEIAWLDTYHARILAEIGPLIQDEAEQDWLRRACAPMG